MDNKKCKLLRKKARNSTSETRVKITLAICLGPPIQITIGLKFDLFATDFLIMSNPWVFSLSFVPKYQISGSFFNSLLLEKLLFSNKIIKKCISSTQVFYKKSRNLL